MDSLMKNEMISDGNETNRKLLVETAVSAGEIMLVSGAEIFRVEDTVKRILQLSGSSGTQTVALGTSLFVRLDSSDGKTVTVFRRIENHSSNLNRICRVNEISRCLCQGEISLAEAYKKLDEIRRDIQYSPKIKAIGYVGVSAFFAVLLGGTWLEGLGAGIAGALLACVCILAAKVRMNDFFINAMGAFTVGAAALLMQSWAARGMNLDMVITGAIMPLVPGVTFTTAIRDILNGDYASGTSRMMEAVVIALAVAVGIGGAMALVGWSLGGGPTW